MGVVRPNRADMRGGLPRKDRARALRGNMTHPERALWKELREYKLGWRFRRQFPIPPYIVDFACIEARLIIEVDGGQHARPGDHYLRDGELQREGWRVLRFWNNEILSNPQGVLRTIAEMLGPPLDQSPHPDLPRLRGREVKGG